MITNQERQQLANAVRSAGTGDLERIIQCANDGTMSVENLLYLIEVRQKFPLQVHDLDGNLGDTESTAFAGCASVMNLFGKRKNINFGFTGPTLMRDYVGRNFIGMVKELQKIHGFTVTEEELAYYARLEKRMVMRRFATCGIEATPHSKNLIIASEAVGFKLAIASSSAHQRIMLTVKILGLSQYFPPEHCFSGADIGHSKPQPHVYIKAAEDMGEPVERCISYEDAESGEKSAASANMGMRLGNIYWTAADQRAKQAQTLRDAGAQAVTANFAEMPALMWMVANNS